MASLDEKVLMCLADITDFSDTIKKIYGISNCSVNPCAIELFAGELHNYVHSSRRSPHLVKSFFFNFM